MSKMNALSIDAQEAAYEQFIESQRNELIQEGRDELAAELIRDLKVQQTWHQSKAVYDEIWFASLQWVIDKLEGTPRN